MGSRKPSEIHWLAFADYYRIDARLRTWLEALLEEHLPPLLGDEPNDVGRQIDPARQEEVVLAICHLRLIKSIRALLIRNDLIDTDIEAEVAVGIDRHAAPATAKLELIRFWREPAETDRVGRVRARLEAFRSA